MERHTELIVRRKEKEFKDYIYSEPGGISAGKKVILNSK